MDNIIDPSTRIEEAHGLWELQVMRLAAMVEALRFTPLDEPRETRGTYRDVLIAASNAERAAFDNWQRVSKECGA